MRVLIADDQRVVREGLATLIGTLDGIDVVGLAADGNEAVALSGELRPDVVLMDLRMPGMDGASATAVLHASVPSTRVVVLTTYADDASVLGALAAGAVGFLTKDATRDDLRRALEAAAAGQSVLDAAAQEALVRAATAGGSADDGSARNDGSVDVTPAGRSLPDGLTQREAEVLVLIADGRSNQEIATQLYVAEATVKTHVNRIFAKTGSRDRAQAATYAFRQGLAR